MCSTRVYVAVYFANVVREVSMKITHTVSTKIGDDRELLDLLKAGSAETPIGRIVALKLNVPSFPRGSSRDEKDVYYSTVHQLAQEATNTFSGITNLTLHNIVEGIGLASVTGTTEALVQAIECGIVKSAFLGDRKIVEPAHGSHRK